MWFDSILPHSRDSHIFLWSARMSLRHSGKGHRKWIWLYRAPGHQDCLQLWWSEYCHQPCSLHWPWNMICLFQSDATYNKFLGTVMTMNEKPIISGKVISILKEQDSINNKWADSGAKYVVWHTGFFTTKEKAVAQWKNWTKMTIISPLSADVPMSVMAMDHVNSIQIVSNASFTSNCLGLLGKVIMTTLTLLKDWWLQSLPSLPPRNLWRALMTVGLPRSSSVNPLALLMLQARSFKSWMKAHWHHASLPTNYVS